MTKLEKLEQARQELDRQIKEEKQRSLETRLRQCFQHLAMNESIPVLSVIEELVKYGGPKFPFEKFTQKLESLIEFHLKNKFTDD